MARVHPNLAKYHGRSYFNQLTSAAVESESVLELTLVALEKGSLHTTLVEGIDLANSTVWFKDIQSIFGGGESLIENSNDLIQVFSLDEKPVFFNKSWKQTFGYSDAEIPHLKLRDIIHPDYAFKTFEYLRRAIDGEDLGVFDTVLMGREGQKVYVQGRIICNLVEGEVAALTGIFRDQTAKIRAQRLQKIYYQIAKLAHSSDKLEHLLENIHQLLEEHIDAPNFYMSLLDMKRGVLDYPYYVDEVFGGKVIAYQRAKGTGLVEYVLDRAKPVFLHERDVLKLAREGRVNLMGPVPKMWLGVPVTINDQHEGVIAVKSHRNQLKFTLNDLELLDFIAGQVGQFIERLRSIREVGESRAKLNAIFDSGSHLIWSVSKQRGLTSFNKNYAQSIFELYGDYPEIDPEGLKPRLLLSAPEFHSVVSEKYDQAFKGIQQHFETRHISKEGHVIWREIFLNPIYQPDGSIDEVSGISHDITEKKNANLAMQQSEEQFRNIFESFQDIYLRIELDWSVQLVSPSVYELTGYQPSEIIGKDIRRFFGTEENLRVLVEELVEQGKVLNFEANVLCKDGRAFPSLANIRVIYDEEHNPIAIDGVVRDITEIKEAAEELIKARDMAERSLQVKENFLANMSHEIRTPMNGIIAMIDLIRGTILDETQTEYVETIAKSSRILLNILNDILDLSKLEAGKMELRPDPFNLEDAVEKIFFLFRQQAEVKGIGFKFSVDSNLPSYVIADETRLIQILSNLTSNSIKFTNKGQIEIKVTKGQVRGDEIFVRFEISDTGIGISKENIQLLFQDFTQIQNAITKSYGGTGLGLSISKALCHLMGGDIGVDSELGEGSNFWFTIRTREAEATEAEKEGSGIDVNAEHFADSRPHVLLVDDNSVNLRVARIILEKAGCTVDTAENGVEAIECVKNQGPYNVILMDIQMPVMDGIKATRELKKLFGDDLPTVVAMTAFSMEDDRKLFLKVGMDDYLAKPITPEKLIRKLQRIFGDEAPEEMATEAVKPIEELPVIDESITQQLKSLGGDDMLQEMFQDFDQETSDALGLCSTAVQEKDVPQILSILHSIKGTSATIGVMRVSEKAKSFEAQLKQGKVDNLIGQFSALEEAFHSFRDYWKNKL